MQHWDLAGIDVEPSNPVVIDSQQEARAIAIQLPAGSKLSEHQVHERAWLVVVRGSIEVSEPGGDPITGEAGLMVEWDPNERHEVRAAEDARLLLILAPWPGEGHPSNRS